MDKASQKPAGGRLLRFAAGEAFAAVAARCDKAYPGVAHRRLLCLTPTYLLVFDDLSAAGAAARRFDWVYHSRGSSVRCAAADKAGDLGGRYVGGEYIRNVHAGATAEAVRVRFADKDVTTHLTMDAASGTEVRVGDGVGESVFDRVPLVMVTRRGRSVRFAAVLEPVAKGARPGVTSVSCDRADGADRITVRRGSHSDVITLTDKNELTVTAGGKVVLVGK